MPDQPADPLVTRREAAQWLGAAAAAQLLMAKSSDFSLPLKWRT